MHVFLYISTKQCLNIMFTGMYIKMIFETNQLVVRKLLTNHLQPFYEKLNFSCQKLNTNSVYERWKFKTP